MSVRATTRTVLGLAVAALLLAPGAPVAGQAPAAGQEKRAMFEEQDAMGSVLSRLEGKPVRGR